MAFYPSHSRFNLKCSPRLHIRRAPVTRTLGCPMHCQGSGDRPSSVGELASSSPRQFQRRRVKYTGTVTVAPPLVSRPLYCSLLRRLSTVNPADCPAGLGRGMKAGRSRPRRSLMASRYRGYRAAASSLSLGGSRTHGVPGRLH